MALLSRGRLSYCVHTLYSNNRHLPSNSGVPSLPEAPNPFPADHCPPSPDHLQVTHDNRLLSSAPGPEVTDPAFPAHPGLPLSSWISNQPCVVKLARSIFKFKSGGSDYGRRAFPAWEKPLSTSHLTAASSLRLTAGEKYVTLSSYVSWSSFAICGGRNFCRGPLDQFHQAVKYKEFLILAIELLAEDSGHLSYLRYVAVYLCDPHPLPQLSPSHCPPAHSV